MATWTVESRPSVAMWALSEKPKKKDGPTADPTCEAIGKPQSQAHPKSSSMAESQQEFHLHTTGFKITQVILVALLSQGEPAHRQ